MITSLVSILIAASLFLGGAGITVFAAQDELPGSPLYRVKTVSEEVHLVLTPRLEDRLALNLEFAERRVGEIEAVITQKASLPGTAIDDLQNRLDLALELAAGLDDEGLPPVLDQASVKLQYMEQTFSRLEPAAGSGVQPALARAREMVHLRALWVQEGMTDPQAFRERIRSRGAQQGAGESDGRPSPIPGGNISGTNLDRTPGAANGYGPGPDVTGTPVPGSGYGPGPEATCTPQTRDWQAPGPHGSNTTPAGGGQLDPGSSPQPENCNGCGQELGPKPTQSAGTGDGQGAGQTGPSEGGEPDHGTENGGSDGNQHDPGHEGDDSGTGHGSGGNGRP